MQIEKKVLYLIQLWYDTFMMHEAEFPFIMENYKTLRKEGIKFPDRDPSEIHMINFSGQKSPIFNVLEEQKSNKNIHYYSLNSTQHNNHFYKKYNKVAHRRAKSQNHGFLKYLRVSLQSLS